MDTDLLLAIAHHLAVFTLVAILAAELAVLGASGWGYYVANYAFWAKMAAFLAMGLLTVPPTMAIRQWLKAQRAEADYAVPADAVARNRRYLYGQAGMLMLIPVFAAMMARGYGVE